MSFRRVVSIAVAALVVAAALMPASAQQRLSDVAGNIRLKKPADEAFLVDLGGDLRAEKRESLSPVGLLELTEDLADQRHAVSAVFRQAATPGIFADRQWRARLLVAMEAFDNAFWTLDGHQPPDRYAGAYRRVIDGGRECGEANRRIRTALESGAPLFDSAGSYLRRGEELMTAGLDEMRIIQRTEIVEAGEPLEDPLTSADQIEAFCGLLYRVDSAGRAGCIDHQQRARRALGDRFAALVQLDEPTFNIIRHDCRREWGADFVSRNACEKERIAETGSR